LTSFTDIQRKDRKKNEMVVSHVRQPSLLSGQNVRWPRCMLLLVSMLTGQTDRRTDAKPLNYAFRYMRPVQ